MTGTRLNDCTLAPDEQAKYTTSNADVMELAKHLYNMARYPAANDDGGKRTINGIARALTEYGQRVAEADRLHAPLDVRR
jgi:hypothetical protein